MKDPAEEAFWSGGNAHEKMGSAEMIIEDCYATGTTRALGGATTDGSPKSNPRTSPPDGVPMSAEEAAAGLSSGGSGGTSDGSTGNDNSQPQLPNILTIETVDNAPLVEYEFTVEGTVAKASNTEGNDTIEESGGTTTVTGATGNGYTDDYPFDGSLTAWNTSADAQHYRILVNGQEIDSSKL